MSEHGLAERIGQPLAYARHLLQRHHDTYHTFWRWSDAAVAHATLRGMLQTVFGWTIQSGAGANARSLRNFPMQANGAEMLRLACCLTTERGIRVCAPVHDALLIEAPLDELAHAVVLTRQCMRQASEAVLAGYALRTDAKLFVYPGHYQDARVTEMWQT